LGLGAARLPLSGSDTAGPDEAESIKLIRYAIDRGINYLDLGCLYDIGRHKHLTRIISRALRGGYRQKTRLTATLPSFLISSPPDFEGYLNKQLEWLGEDGVDFLIFGGLNRESWPRLKALDALGWAEKSMSSGRIGHLGFSFRDHYQALREILADYDNWTLAQFQYSFMDADRQPGVSGLKYAADKGLAVVAAGPLRGGRLAKEPPGPVAKIWANAPEKRPPAEWGLRWVWNHPEIATVVSDMGTTAQVAENAALADLAEPDSLTVAEEVLISRVREAYRRLQPIPCTACRGCMPCPRGIDVPRLFEIYNDAIIYGDIETARVIYRAEKHDIDSCTECGICVCGREIDIPDWLKKARRLLA
jgi:predicted aldo/keto reductase-like oxidoreductase